MVAIGVAGALCALGYAPRGVLLPLGKLYHKFNTERKNMASTKKKKKYIQSTKWFITQNNPQKYGIKDFEDFQNKIKSLCPIWAIFSHERGKINGLDHFHCGVVLSHAIRNTTLNRLLPHADLQRMLGTYAQARSYTLKIDEDEDRGSISLATAEYGTMPLTVKERGKISSEQLIEDIKSGKSVLDIVESNPNLYAFKVKQINELRQKYLGKLYLGKARERPLTFIVRCGATGTGKTRAVMEEFGSDVYRVTVYRNHGLGPYYDGFDGHKCLCFEEFNSSSVPIEEMLMISDPYYYTELNCRYQNAVGTYDTLIINTNTLFENLYRELLLLPKTVEKYRAWLRRITEIQLYKSDGTVKKYSVKEYLSDVVNYDERFAQLIIKNSKQEK